MDSLVAAATEGMRKASSADEIKEAPKPMAPPRNEDGHMSDSAVAPTRERKKGVPWTEEEHRLFLLGLQKLGKGDWRGISRHFVQSRTPTQVASHAQKYFIRQNNLNKRKRRSSLFDIISEPSDGENVVNIANGAAMMKSTDETNNGKHAKKPPLAANAGGLSRAFAGGIPPAGPAFAGYNPTGMPPPASFSSHGRRPPSTSTGDSAVEAAAATIAALAGTSPHAAAGYHAAAAAAAARERGARTAAAAPTSAEAAVAHAQATAAAQAQAQAQAAMSNPWGGLMAQMMAGPGAAYNMGPGAAASQMNIHQAQANWMAHYHQFLQQMQHAVAAAPQQMPWPQMAGAGGLTFPTMAPIGHQTSAPMATGGGDGATSGATAAKGSDKPQAAA